MSFLRGTTSHKLMPKECLYFVVSIFYMRSLSGKQKWFIHFKPFRAMNHQTFSNFPDFLLVSPFYFISGVPRGLTPWLPLVGLVTHMRSRFKSFSTQPTKPTCYFHLPIRVYLTHVKHLSIYWLVILSIQEISIKSSEVPHTLPCAGIKW